MKVCPKCKRIYEDAKQMCPHDDTPLQVKTDPQKPNSPSKSNPPQTEMPKLDPIAHLARETEQQRLKTQRTILTGFAVCSGVVLLLLLGGSPWMGGHSPSSDSQTETAVAVNEEPASPAPAQLASSGAQVAEKPEAAPPAAAKQPHPAKSEPEPEKAVVAEEPERAPEPQAAAEEAAPTPEPEKNMAVKEPESAPAAKSPAVTEQAAPTPDPQRAPPPEQPTHKATAPHPTLTPKPEKRVTTPAPARVAGQEHKTPARVQAAERQTQLAPPAQKPQMHARPEQKKPRTPMVWIYKTKTVTPLLSKAKAGASVVKQLKSGEQLRVVGWAGNYLVVRSSAEGASSVYVHPQDVTLMRIE